MHRIILKNHLSPARTANWRNMGNTSITLNWRGELDHTLLRRSPKPIWRYITTTQHWRNMTGTPAVLNTKQRNRPFQAYWSLLCASLSKRVLCKNEFDKIWMKINQHAEHIFIWKVLHKFKTQSIVLTRRQKGNSEVTYWQKNRIKRRRDKGTFIKKHLNNNNLGILKNLKNHYQGSYLMFLKVMI